MCVPFPATGNVNDARKTYSQYQSAATNPNRLCRSYFSLKRREGWLQITSKISLKGALVYYPEIGLSTDIIAFFSTKKGSRQKLRFSWDERAIDTKDIGAVTDPFATTDCLCRGLLFLHQFSAHPLPFIDEIRYKMGSTVIQYLRVHNLYINHFES